VWIADRDSGWISAEVQNVTRADNKVKIVLQDERGKVSFAPCFSA
jgi:hypothetical protein